jgi:lipid II:glycine glycyltransferase (peptidoglycan interpeptide bridge formation enzyme)
MGWRLFEWTGSGPAWDARLLGLAYPHLLQSWAWGALQEQFGWHVRRLALDLDDHPRGAASVQEGRIPLPTGGIFWYVPRGPALADADAEGWREWQARVRTLATQKQVAAVRVEPESRAVAAWLQEGGYRPDGHVQPLHSTVIDLRPDLAEIRARFKPKTRYNIGLAERRGVTVEVSDDVATLAQLSAATAAREGIHLPGEGYLRALREALGLAGRLYVARARGKALAAILVGSFGPGAYYLYGGSSREGRELMPSYLLHWVALCDARGQGREWYDLWGTHERGLQQFKSGFGGAPVEYLGAHTLVLRPPLWRAYQALQAGKRVLRRTLRPRAAPR